MSGKSKLNRDCWLFKLRNSSEIKLKLNLVKEKDVIVVKVTGLYNKMLNIICFYVQI